MPSFILSSRTLFSGRVVSVAGVDVRMPGGNTADYQIVHYPGSSAILAVDGSGRACLLRQFRPAAGGWLWELPSGRHEPGETPRQTAERELAEEAGCIAAQWRALGAVLSSPGSGDEEVHLFLATGLALQAPRHEPYEAIEIHWVPFAEALDQALSGRIRDARTVVALVRAQAAILIPQGETT